MSTQPTGGLQHHIQELFQQNNVESSLKYFFKTLSTPYVYFEWLPRQYALKLLYSNPSRPPQVIRLYESDSSFHIDQLRQPKKIKALTQWIHQELGQDMVCELISVKNAPFGICCFPQKNDFTDILIQCLQIKCEALIWKRQYTKFSDYDYFLKLLYSEISRSRRLSLPVSLILIQCSFEQKESSDRNLQIFLKSLYNHLYKNSRLYDSMIQISSTEIACILPHTSQEGAFQKAQKIEWTLNSLDSQKIFDATIQSKIVVAEYPSVARDAVGLIQLARQSCEYQKQSGICIATAIPGFLPDFTIATDVTESLCELT